MLVSSSWLRTPALAASSRVRVFGMAINAPEVRGSLQLYPTVLRTTLHSAKTMRLSWMPGSLVFRVFLSRVFCHACFIMNERRNFFERRVRLRYQAGTHLPDMQEP